MSFLSEQKVDLVGSVAYLRPDPQMVEFVQRGGDSPFMRLLPWRDKQFLDVEDEEWQADTWRWFMRRFGGNEDLRRSPLVVPTREFFPPTDAVGHARALHIFSMVKKHARMADWECQLVAQPHRPELRIGEVSALKMERPSPVGTFSFEGNQAVVTYDPASLDDPGMLVATLAHELCHYRIRTLGELPPGGKDAEELATDLGTVYFGFGIFGANSAFRFQQHGDTFSQGWQWARSGYLDQRSWCYALAVFFALRGDALALARRYLKSHLFSDLRRASAYLHRRPERLPAG